ncbi:AAA family ATPase [Acinetobacter nosocomialis]|uniref:AAA family ATPase n=1 Tax=Acinetobacter nosocomialis TaxID=106654 RepID=UPI00244C04E2|nr:hypothetical protein [Acinetobacter nosocomialis]MDH2591938.1 hypothetical protein [Acinetobacter nosocomialis]
MSKLNLLSFKINNLNNEYDIELSFNENKKILVSENGSGKTTILNIFHSFFSLDYQSTIKYKFDSIEIELNNGNVYTFNKNLLKPLLNKENIIILREILNSDFIDEYSKFITRNNINVSEEKVDILNANFSTLIYFYLAEQKWNGRTIKVISEIIAEEFLNDYDLNEVYKITKDYESILSLYLSKDNKNQNESKDFFSIEYDSNTTQSKDKQKQESSSLVESMKRHLVAMDYTVSFFEKCVELNIIYLPTYRRIEHDIESLLTNQKIKDDDFSLLSNNEIRDRFQSNPLIQFGIKDVETTWNLITNDLRNNLIDNFNKFNGLILENTLNFKKLDEDQLIKLYENKKTIQVIFERLGEDNISKPTKENILNILESKDNNNYSYLFYMLFNLIELYEQQEPLKNKISKFIDECNKFLILSKKNIFFDENKVEIIIQKKFRDTVKTIDVHSLSSGEKQVLSLLNRIYLKDFSHEKKYWIIIDEPELSLSIEWQKLLLPTIINTDKCDFLFATTHSPFIFSNDLKEYTSDLSLEMKESSN